MMSEDIRIQLNDHLENPHELRLFSLCRDWNNCLKQVRGRACLQADSPDAVALCDWAEQHLDFALDEGNEPEQQQSQ